MATLAQCQAAYDNMQPPEYYDEDDGSEIPESDGDNDDWEYEQEKDRRLGL